MESPWPPQHTHTHRTASRHGSDHRWRENGVRQLGIGSLFPPCPLRLYVTKRELYGLPNFLVMNMAWWKHEPEAAYSSHVALISFDETSKTCFWYTRCDKDTSLWKTEWTFDSFTIHSLHEVSILIMVYMIYIIFTQSYCYNKLMPLTPRRTRMVKNSHVLTMPRNCIDISPNDNCIKNDQNNMGNV